MTLSLLWYLHHTLLLVINFFQILDQTFSLILLFEQFSNWFHLGHKLSLINLILFHRLLYYLLCPLFKLLLKLLLFVMLFAFSCVYFSILVYLNQILNIRFYFFLVFSLFFLTFQILFYKFFFCWRLKIVIRPLIFVYTKIKRRYVSCH